MDPERAQLMAKEKAGVLLPGVDPMVGEIVLSAFFANEAAPVGQIMAGLILKAPKELAAEIATACFELLLCSREGGKGDLRWLEVSGQNILVGIRHMAHRDGICFGTEAHWPMQALLAGPPKSAVVRLTNRAVRVWLASDGLDGAVVRQSEAVALGNAMVESFGGRIIEDRMGPEAMQQSFIEHNMTNRAKLRAQAMQQADRLTVEKRAQGIKVGHLRIAMAEAFPGSCKEGMTLNPEDSPGTVYEVERRVNGSWVILIAKEPGAAGSVPGPAAWVAGGDPGPFGPEAPPHWGFTEDAVIAEFSNDGPATAESDTLAE